MSISLSNPSSCSTQLTAVETCIAQNPADCTCFTARNGTFSGAFTSAAEVAFVRTLFMPKNSGFCGKATNTLCHRLAKTASCCCRNETDAYQQCIIPYGLQIKYNITCQPSSCLGPGGNFQSGSTSQHEYLAAVAIVLFLLFLMCCCCLLRCRQRPPHQDRDKVRGLPRCIKKLIQTTAAKI